MTRDPLDELGARLFQAAREERLPKGGAERALAAARQGLHAPIPRATGVSRASMWGFTVAGVALAAGIALYAQPQELNDRISAEPTSTRRIGPNRAPATASAAFMPAPSALPSEVPSVVPVVPSGAPAPARAAPVTLTDELNTLKLASNALSTGDTRSAFYALDRYDHVLKGKVMRAEATLLRIEALSRSGQAGAASTLAQRFVEQNPGSPLVDRARSFVQRQQ